jgi:hypothetical protein
MTLFLEGKWNLAIIYVWINLYTWRIIDCMTGVVILYLGKETHRGLHLSSLFWA